ncbi:hypothetical protein FACS189427_13280 [Planctomycetales bacterium]|nr:hypothetical protein FACS189427_13280 [Planctomycetales bacterium]
MSKLKRRQIWLWVALLCCLALLVGGIYRFWLARPVGTGSVGISVSDMAFQRVWSKQKILLLGMGDSITAGFGMDKGYGYVDWMLDNPADEFSDMRGICLRKVFPNICAENIAVSGSTSIQHAEYIETKLKTQPQDVFGLVVWTTGGKMSKSYNNSVEVFEDLKVQNKKIMGITTDSRPIEEPKEPEGDHLFELFSLFASREQIEQLAATYRKGGFGYGSVKKELVVLAEKYFAAAREKREELAAKPEYVRGVLADGAARARKKASEVLQRVQKSCGVRYY